MRLQVVFSVLLTMVLVSCGSGRKAYKGNKKLKKYVPVVYNPKYEVKYPKVVQEAKIDSEAFKVGAEHTTDYIETYASIAMREMILYKIPASITLAQGILESGSGRSKLASRSNNHFGIKCHGDWKGKRVTHDDDSLGECFRKYKHPEISYEDHSKFLANRKRYARLFKLGRFDYESWAYGLKNAGYATDPRYPSKLIELIKKYKLHKYDRLAHQAHKPYDNVSVINRPKKTKAGSPKKRNDSNTYIVVKGDTLYSISRKYGVSVEAIKSKNGMSDNNLSIGQTLIIN